MTSPLVSRPPYGGEIAEAKLPEGTPAQKGVSLDPSIPGTRTFAKPSDEPSRGEGKDDESIFRVDGPDDMTKGPQTVPDETDLTRLRPLPDGKDVTPKTKRPYRDGIPHTAADVVAGLWMLRWASDIRVGARVSEIEDGLNPQVVQRAAGCTVTLKRADVKNLRWIFAVDCGNGPKVVRLRATRVGNVVKLGKMDLFLACSCPAWRWLGAEFHGKTRQYLDGKPRGTASPPDIRDPRRINKVCKHAGAVLRHVVEWDIPTNVKKEK